MNGSLNSNDYFYFTIFCLMLWLIYALTPLKTIKQKSWIITCVSAFVLSMFGIIYTYDAESKQQWTNEYIYGEDELSRYVMIYFAATNFMDLLLGVLYYREFMDPLSTTTHHIFYLIFIYYILCYNYSRGFTICFFMETPTFIRSLGSIWTNYRNDLVFGVVFFIARIVFNIYFVYKLFLLSSGNIFKISIGVLFLHIYWFSKWIISYQKKITHESSNKIL